MVNYNQSNNPKNWAYERVHQTTIDNFRPRFIVFKEDLCYVSSDDCTKTYLFDEHDREKPQVLEIVQKPYGKVLDFRVSSDGKQMYVLDIQSNDDENPKVCLYFADASLLNTDRDVQCVPKVFRAQQVTQPQE